MKPSEDPSESPLRLAPTVLLLAGMLVFGVGGIFLYLDRLTDRLIEDSAIEYASLLSTAIAEFRTLYTSEVVGVAESHGIDVTQDYADRDDAIPLPATLAIMLGDRIGAENTNARTRLYSPYPFPRREESGGLRDDFALAAWERLSANPGETFVRFSGTDDSRVLRFATADLMRAECVSCHNTHPDTPKADWQEGDVRGVLEVILPIDRQVEQAQAMLRSTFVLLAGLIALAVAAFVVASRRLRRYAHQENRLEKKLNEALTHALSGFIPICAWCKNVKEVPLSDWTPIEEYVGARTEAQFSHGMCPECSRKHAQAP